jgi:DnaK suppressor protein
VDLTKAQIAELHDALLRQRGELEAELVSLDTAVDIKADCTVTDRADAAALQDNRFQAASLRDNRRKLLAEILAALSRMDNGVYGVSQSTGEPIVYERLKLVPWARS